MYDLYEVELKAKWFPVFYYLSSQEQVKPITSIAIAIGQSHPSVVKTVREMADNGLVIELKDEKDGRKNNISLSEKGLLLAVKIKDQYTDVQLALKNTLAQTQHNLWLAIQEFEFLLDEQSLLSRVLKEKKIRESSTIRIISFLPEHNEAFKRLNEEWISKYFKIEDADKKALDDPQGNILDDGGEILVAVDGKQALGVCALIKLHNDEYDYELAKMAVSPIAHGKGIGYLLGKAIIKKAHSLGASKIYLESNTMLKPAISLYLKLGFEKLARRQTPYERANIQMGLKLK